MVLKQNDCKTTKATSARSKKKRKRKRNPTNEHAKKREYLKGTLFVGKKKRGPGVGEDKNET